MYDFNGGYSFPEVIDLDSFMKYQNLYINNLLIHVVEDHI